MRYRLNSEVVQTASLKAWDFVCRYERASRALRVKLARAAKRRSRQLMKAEIETYGDDLSPRCKTHRTRRYPSKCIRVCIGWGGSKYSVSIWLGSVFKVDVVMNGSVVVRQAKPGRGGRMT